MVIYGSCVDENVTLVPGFLGYDSTGAVIEYVTLVSMETTWKLEIAPLDGSEQIDGINKRTNTGYVGRKRKKQKNIWADSREPLQICCQDKDNAMLHKTLEW